MQHRPELRARVQWMFLTFTPYAAALRFVRGRRKGRDRAWLLGGRWLPLGFLSTIVASAACALRSRNSSNLSQSGTSVCVWLCRCHLNMVTESSFNSRSEVMNFLDGSWSRAFKALGCWMTVSWRARSSLPVPSLRLGASMIQHTCV